LLLLIGKYPLIKDLAFILLISGLIFGQVLASLSSLLRSSFKPIFLLMGFGREYPSKVQQTLLGQTKSLMLIFQTKIILILRPILMEQLQLEQLNAAYQ